MAKKYQAKEPDPKQPAKQETITITGSQPFRFTASNLIPLGICLVYLGVSFIPNLDAYDAMGPQWLYLVIVDMLVIIYILAKKNDYDLAANTLFRNLFSRLYIVFFVLAGLSSFTAINPTETWVCYVRLIATIVAYFNISIVFHGRVDLFKWLAQLLSLLLLVEAFQTISDLRAGFGNTPMTTLIMSLKGTAGNKNIFAADLVVKIPFVIYCIYSAKLWRRVLNMFILAIGVFTIFMVNARAAYLSLVVMAVLYIFYCILEHRKAKKTELTMYRIGYVLLPLLAAFFVSQIVLTSLKSLEDAQTQQDFGSVTERLGSLAATSDESNQVRLRLWAHAVDYTKKHPFIGCGYGNWKIASIPYQRTITNDLYVPIHAHNDFVETFAELGIPGGLLYLAMFVCILVYTVRTYVSNANEQTKFMSVFSLMAFAGYSIDALFNFPTERPISQLYFALIVAVNVTAYHQARMQPAEEVPKVSTAVKPAFGLIAILFLLPATYITYLTYQSLIVQRTIIPDMEHEPLQLKWQELFPKIPSIPNISASAQPMDAIKGRYLYEAGKYEEAIALLDKGAKANPVIGYSEFLKAGVYVRMGKIDSAVINATKAFYTRPKAKTYYQTLMAVLSLKKDTVAIQKAFEEYDRYRHHSNGYNLYLMAMLHAIGKGTPKLLQMADSGLHLFGNDTSLMVRKAEILQFMERPVISSGTEAAAENAKAQVFYNDGINAFNKAKAGTAPANKEDYLIAARNFLKAAAITPGNYLIYENAAISYFNMGDFAKALIYLDKVIAMNVSSNGKPEFFKGAALFNLGKSEDGCKYLKQALAKGWQEADGIIKSRCK